jgi:hypothetical protein
MRIDIQPLHRQALWIIACGYFSRDSYRDPGAHILDSLARTERFNRWMADTIRPGWARVFLNWARESAT